MPVATPDGIDTDARRFSHGLRDRKNDMPKSRLTDGKDPYDMGYRQGDIYQDVQPEPSVTKDYRRDR